MYLRSLVMGILIYGSFLYAKNEESSKGGAGFNKPPAEELKKKLNEMQFKVTQKKGTEPAFDNEYWNHKEEGIYVDVVTGEALFSSKHKFDSGTGWPSFYRPIDENHIVTEEDKTFLMTRTEVKSKKGDSHLGHVFDDAPSTPTGLRYCMNSASLRFIPKAKMKELGYGKYLKDFEEKK